MKTFFAVLIVCLIITIANACPDPPCPSGQYCVRVLGANMCSKPAKKSHACSAEPGRKGVYDMVPPCASGLTCDTSKTIHTCE
ncbi:hypothetical protein TNCT_99271 [Trichonephila clavata]|uniref:Uncharacterized protein n=1 Tax=Trichonephila clavata TaxID=2740835 RepID=A0A8X6EXE8_TRICU|nr:hypothetical protein TNCT_99271 [Trichonephila clavata]